jgi:hypothetical protein
VSIGKHGAVSGSSMVEILPMPCACAASGCVDFYRKDATRVCARAYRARDIPVVIMHQDAFAADYQEEEYRLIGMAIKFSGIGGKEVRVRGRNRDC